VEQRKQKIKGKPGRGIKGNVPRGRKGQGEGDITTGTTSRGGKKGIKGMDIPGAEKLQRQGKEGEKEGEEKKEGDLKRVGMGVGDHTAIGVSSPPIKLVKGVRSWQVANEEGGGVLM